jgi:hypothetical protein
MSFPKSDAEPTGKKKLNNKVDLLGTAKNWIEKEEDQEKTKYSLKISGRGGDGRCEWCMSFFSALRTKAKKDGLLLDEDWRCIFEDPVPPGDRYAERIKRLQRDYE